MKLTIKQQLDTHDKLIAELLHGVFETSKQGVKNKEMDEAFVRLIDLVHYRIGIQSTALDKAVEKYNKTLKRLQWVVIAQGLSLLAIVYLLWLKL